ncbi:hypothetical protein D3C75_385630 [compost metagenome]
MIRHQVTVKFTPDEFVKPNRTGPALQRLRLLDQQTMQALARRQDTQRQAGGESTGAFDGREIALQFILPRPLLAETAQLGDCRFFAGWEQIAVERLLGIVEIQRGGRNLLALSHRWGRRTLRQSLFQAAQVRVFKGGEDFVHLVIAGHHAARRQHYTVIKSLTDHRLQLALQLPIALLFVEFILIVVEEVRHVVLVTNLQNLLTLGGKVAHLGINQRDTFVGQLLL